MPVSALLNKHVHLQGEPGDDILDTATDLSTESLLSPRNFALDNSTNLLAMQGAADAFGAAPLNGGHFSPDTASLIEQSVVTIHLHGYGPSSVTFHSGAPFPPYDSINTLSSDQFGDSVLGTAVLSGGQQVVLSAAIINNVTYNGFTTYPGYSAISETIIDNGVPTTKTLTLSASFIGTPDGQDLAKVVPLTGGDFVVVDEARVTGTNLYFDLFDSSGNKISSGQINGNPTNHNAAELNDSFNLAATSNNGFVVEWKEGNAETGHLETFSVNGSTVSGSGDFQFHNGDSDATGSAYIGTMAVATNGNVIVATNPVGAGDFASANFAIYNASGGTVVGSTSFATAEGSLLPNESSSMPGDTGNPLENAFVAPQFVALPTGGFLAVIANPTAPYNGSFAGFNMYLQTISATGAFGTPELIETTTNGSADNTLNPVVLSDGKVVIDFDGHFNSAGAFVPGTYEIYDPANPTAPMTQVFPSGVAPVLGTVSITGAVSPVTVFTPITGGTGYFLDNYFSADNHGGVFAALQSGIFTGYTGYGWTPISMRRISQRRRRRRSRLADSRPRWSKVRLQRVEQERRWPAIPTRTTERSRSPLCRRMAEQLGRSVRHCRGHTVI